MSETARITALLKTAIAFLAAMLCCGVAFFAHAQSVQYYPYAGPDSDAIAESKSVKQSEIALSPSPKKGLEIISRDSLHPQKGTSVAQDCSALAARQSPYRKLSPAYAPVAAVAQTVPATHVSERENGPARQVLALRRPGSFLKKMPASKALVLAADDENYIPKPEVRTEIAEDNTTIRGPEASKAMPKRPLSPLKTIPASAPIVTVADDSYIPLPELRIEMIPDNDAVTGSKASGSLVTVEAAMNKVSPSRPSAEGEVLKVSDGDKSSATQNAVREASMLTSQNASRAAHQQSVTLAATGELASVILYCQQAVAQSASSAAAEGVKIQTAANDTRGLSKLSPAAGQPASPGASLPSLPPVLPGGGPAIVGSDVMPLPPAAAAPVTAAATPTMNTPPSRLSSLPPSPQGLDKESEAIVDRLPPEKKKPQRINHPVSIAHQQKNPLDNASSGDDIRHHDAMGISIEVRRPKLDTNDMLEHAYDALVAGNQEDAIALYKRVLENAPNNKLALFGLATTYHRAGQLNLARPLYGRLLAIDPQNKEGLNNFLVLLADESPQQALSEMKRLEMTHPDFSPLPAQMAVIYEKLGDHGRAIENMQHAIDLNPENIKYRYDMAVMLDNDNDWADAAIFYEQILAAEARGEKIPAKGEEIQERLTFIRSNRPAMIAAANTKHASEDDPVIGAVPAAKADYLKP